MAPLTQSIEVDHYVDQELRTYAIRATTKIFKGAMVGIDSNGYARGLVAGDRFVGMAYEEKDNLAGANGALKLRIQTLGDFELPMGTATQANLGRPVFASDDATLTFTASGNTYIGVLVDVPATGRALLRIDSNRKMVKTIVHAVENLAAGADIAARAIHAFNQEGWIVAARVVNQATAASGVDGSNTSTIALAIDAGAVVTEVFDNVTTFPLANAAQNLGAVGNTHANAGDVLTLAVTNGATADLGSFLVEVDYI